MLLVLRWRSRAVYCTNELEGLLRLRIFASQDSSFGSEDVLESCRGFSSTRPSFIQAVAYAFIESRVPGSSGPNFALAKAMASAAAS